MKQDIKLPLIIAISILLFVSAFFNFKQNTTNKRTQSKVNSLRNEAGQSLDDFLGYKKDLKDIKDAYVFVRANVDAIKNASCYCGCQKDGMHKSLADCFVDKISDKSVIEYSEHGMNCSLCVEEAIEFKKLIKEDRPYSEIGRIIDAKYKPKNSK